MFEDTYIGSRLLVHGPINTEITDYGARQIQIHTEIRLSAVKVSRPLPVTS